MGVLSNRDEQVDYATIPAKMTDATNEALRILIEERDRINKAIELLQGDSGAAPRRRGRPPGSGKAAKKAAKKRRGGRRQMTEAEKKAVSDRMKKYWAARRKGKK